MATPEENENHITELARNVTELRKEVQDLKASIESLLSAWKAGGLLFGLVKWFATIASGFAIVWATMTGKKV